MFTATRTEVAAAFGFSADRVSQLVSDGRLDGCWSGDHRDRRFDIAACARALNRRLDSGQALGNGAASASAARALLTDHQSAPAAALPREPEIENDAPARYAAARAEQAEIAARAARRKEALEHGRYVLATESGAAAARLLADEITAFEQFLRDLADETATAHGLETRPLRAAFAQALRAHRDRRARALRATAEQAAPTAAEQAEIDALAAA